MRVLGLTGGIASGKSSVARLLVERGLTVIDFDELAREVVQVGEPLLAQVFERFGEDLKCSDGSLDRRRLRARIFNDPNERQALQALLHPAIRARFLQKRQALSQTHMWLVAVIPLLVESQLQSLVDTIVVVDCEPHLQLERLIARDHSSASEALQILNAQASRQERLAVADEIIINDKSLAELTSQVDALCARLALAPSAQAKKP